MIVQWNRSYNGTERELFIGRYCSYHMVEYVTNIAYAILVFIYVLSTPPPVKKIPLLLCQLRHCDPQ